MLNILSLAFSVGDVPCKLVTVNPCNQGKPEERMHLQHSHSGCEIHYVKSGILTVDCIGDSYPLAAGQILLIPAGVYHYVRSISDDIDRMDLQIEINKGQKSKDPDLDRFLQGLFLKRPVLLQEDAHRELFMLLRRIQQITIDEGSATFLRQEWLKALCLELVLMLGTAVQTHAAGEISTAFESTDLIPERYIMDQFFNHNYHGNSDMGMLAGELHMSVRQTGRLLQKTYGKGFREKMNECRLAVALDLIKNTTKSMYEISETLGYGGPTNFSAFIKRQTGKTPAQIRKEV